MTTIAASMYPGKPRRISTTTWTRSGSSVRSDTTRLFGGSVGHVRIVFRKGDVAEEVDAARKLLETSACPAIWDV